MGGIGADAHGWSWYVNQPSQSFVYIRKKLYTEDLQYGLRDGDECIFEVIIADGKCVTNVYYQTLQDKPLAVQFDTVQTPVRVGVSMNAKHVPMSLRIVDQDR